MALAALAVAQEPAEPRPLLPGDPAPALRVAEWIQGTPVESFQEGKPYVVEFWATWCAPCKRSIPHINELYLQRLDVALQHFETYQDLVGEDKQVEKWIADLRRRGAATQRTANVAE